MAENTRALTRKMIAKVIIRTELAGLACAFTFTFGCACGSRFAGKRAIKRATMLPVADRAHRPFGRPEIMDVNRRVAISRGSWLRRSASSQGSTPDRASADKVVRTMPFSSSPIGANRKSLNAEVRSANTDCDVAVLALIGHMNAR